VWRIRVGMILGGRCKGWKGQRWERLSREGSGRCTMLTAQCERCTEKVKRQRDEFLVSSRCISTWQKGCGLRLIIKEIHDHKGRGPWTRHSLQ
jgi:hypothetical protein